MKLPGCFSCCWAGSPGYVSPGRSHTGVFAGCRLAAYQQQLQVYERLRFQAISGRLVLYGDVWPIVALMATLATAVFGRADLSVGEFLAFNTSLMIGVAAVVSLGKGSVSLLDGLRECERFAPILAAAPEVNEISGELVRLAGAIRLDNVSFRYAPDGPFVLENVNFQVRPGEFVASRGHVRFRQVDALASLARVRDTDRRVRIV